MTEPTAAPQNISFALRNASSITLSWNPPPFEHQNGLIRSYSIIVTHISSGFQQQITTNSGATNYTVGGLQPFMNYTFSLAAETVGLGPYSLTVTIGTVEGGRYYRPFPSFQCCMPPSPTHFPSCNAVKLIERRKYLGCFIISSFTCSYY